jgi:hypothetical protein
MAEEDHEKIISEIENLEQGVQSVSDQLKALKEKAKSGVKISASELNITVSDINRLDVMMRDRRDVGH